MVAAKLLGENGLCKELICKTSWVNNWEDKVVQ